MPVTVANLTQGAGVLYHGAFGATEPAVTATSTAPAVEAWTDVGATVGGIAFRYTPTYAELEADQLIDVPGRRLVKREAVFIAQLAEPTLENIVLAMNMEGAITTNASAEASTHISPDAESVAVQPTYKAFILDGWAEGAEKRRRIVIRRALAVAQFDLAYQKDGQTLIPVEFHAHYVSASIRPWQIIDQT